MIGSFDGWQRTFIAWQWSPPIGDVDWPRALVAEIERWLIQPGVKKTGALVENDRPGSMAFWQAAGYLPDPRIIRYVKMPGKL